MSGLAKQIREKFPVVYDTYKKLCGSSNAPDLLGQVQVVLVSDIEIEEKYIANVFGQSDYGYNGKQYTDYNALDTAFQTICEAFGDKRIVIPFQLGCGLGGGDCTTVLGLIAERLGECDVIIYKYNG